MYICELGVIHSSIVKQKKGGVDPVSLGFYLLVGAAL